MHTISRLFLIKGVACETNCIPLTLVSITSSWLSMAAPEFLREAALLLRVFFRGLPQTRQEARRILLPQPQDTQFLSLLIVGVVRPRRLGVGIGGWALVSSLSGHTIVKMASL